jgi:hypothetical protein
MYPNCCSTVYAAPTSISGIRSQLFAHCISSLSNLTDQLGVVESEYCISALVEDLGMRNGLKKLLVGVAAAVCLLPAGLLPADACGRCGHRIRHTSSGVRNGNGYRTSYGARSSFYRSSYTRTRYSRPVVMHRVVSRPVIVERTCSTPVVLEGTVYRKRHRGLIPKVYSLIFGG